MDAISLPNRAKVETLEENKYKLTLEPLYPGYGVTVGNALRRVLLSSMPGSAVTAVKIKFVDHEFSTIPNVKEDVIQILLQLKQLRLQCFSAEPQRVYIKVKGEKIVTADDIKETDLVKVVNKNLHIATLDNKNADFEMELVVEQGRGYLPVEQRDGYKKEIGMIAIDAVFTPIKSVYFDISNVRVGQLTNFDKLEITMDTDGTINGSEAVNIAAHILVDHFSMLFSEEPIQASTIVANSSEFSESNNMVDNNQLSTENSIENFASDDSLNQEDEISNTALSTRAKNALLKNNIRTLKALKDLSNEQIENIEGLGKKTINEIIEYLANI